MASRRPGANGRARRIKFSLPQHVASFPVSHVQMHAQTHARVCIRVSYADQYVNYTHVCVQTYEYTYTLRSARTCMTCHVDTSYASVHIHTHRHAHTSNTGMHILGILAYTRLAPSTAAKADDWVTVLVMVLVTACAPAGNCSWPLRRHLFLHMYTYRYVCM